MAVAHLMVGLPAAGKTTRARELEVACDALRLTPDEWMAPMFGDSRGGRARDVLEGRFVQVALRVLALGADVVLDFGLWSRDERTALRWLAGSVGAGCRVEYLAVDPAVQRVRVVERWKAVPHTTFEMTADDLDAYGRLFTEPTDDELSDGPLDPVPAGFADWGAWAAERWPSFEPPGR